MKDLLEKYNDIISWWLTSIVLLTVYIPRFGILLFSVAAKYAERYKAEINSYKEGIEFVFPDIMEKTEERRRIKKEARLKKRGKRTTYQKAGIYLRKQQYKYFGKPYEKESFYLKNIIFFARRLSDYAERYEHELVDMATKFTNKEDRKRFDNGAATMKVLQNKMDEFIELIENNPNLFIRGVNQSKKRSKKAYGIRHALLRR